MPRRQPYPELLAERDRLSLQNLALSVAYDTTPDGEYTHRDGRDVYRWRLFGASRFDGGYLIGTFRSHIDPHPKHRVYYVERLDTAHLQVQQRYSSFADCGMCTAVDRFVLIRQRLLDAA